MNFDTVIDAMVRETNREPSTELKDLLRSIFGAAPEQRQKIWITALTNPALKKEMIDYREVPELREWVRALFFNGAPKLPDAPPVAEGTLTPRQKKMLANKNE